MLTRDDQGSEVQRCVGAGGRGGVGLAMLGIDAVLVAVVTVLGG